MSLFKLLKIVAKKVMSKRKGKRRKPEEPRTVGGVSKLPSQKLLDDITRSVNKDTKNFPRRPRSGKDRRNRPS